MQRDIFKHFRFDTVKVCEAIRRLEVSVPLATDITVETPETIETVLRAANLTQTLRAFATARHHERESN